MLLYYFTSLYINFMPQVYAEEYRKVIEKELHSICHEVLDLLGSYLVNTAVELYKAEETESNAESAVFYLKMKGDYYRFFFWLSKNIGATHHWCSAEKLLWKCLRKRHEWSTFLKPLTTQNMCSCFSGTFLKMFRTVISTSSSRQLHLEFSKLTTKEQRQLTHFKPVFHFYPPPPPLKTSSDICSWRRTGTLT